MELKLHNFTVSLIEPEKFHVAFGFCNQLLRSELLCVHVVALKETKNKGCREKVTIMF
jgi:hypothetical protein